MTVRELIEKLTALEPNATVVLAADPEGNGFDSLFQLGTGRWDPQERELLYAEDDSPLSVDEDDEDGAACVVLWP